MILMVQFTYVEEKCNEIHSGLVKRSLEVMLIIIILIIISHRCWVKQGQLGGH